MKKTILPVLTLLFLVWILTACTHGAPGQQSSPTAAASSSISSTVSPGASAATTSDGSGTASVAAGSGNLKKSLSAQNQELQDILNNLNGAGNSAGSLDEPTSSDLTIPSN